MDNDTRHQDRSSPPDVFEHARLAAWRCASGGSGWEWDLGAPAWLPPGLADSFDALFRHTDATHGAKLVKALGLPHGKPFRLILPLASPSGVLRWLSLQGQQMPGGGIRGIAQDVTENKRVETALRAEILGYRRAAADANTVFFEATLPDWRMRRIDVGIEELAGYPRDTWLTQPGFIRHLVAREDQHRFAPGNLLRPDADQVSFVFRMRGSDGQMLPLSAIFRLHRDPTGGKAVARGIFMLAERDYSLAMTADDHERHLKILYDENPAMFFSISPEGVVRTVNKYGAIRLGYRPEELTGMPAADVHLPSQRALAQAHFERCLNDIGNVHHWETCLRRRDGGDVWVRVAARAIETSGKREILIVCEDITETRRLSEQLSYQENYDLLTGLANRQRFQQDLDLAASQAVNGQHHVLCYIDLDHFKVINDTSGHDTGDKLLLRVARLLARHVRECDALARLGGDEFGILYRNCSLKDALTRAEQIVLSLSADRFYYGDQSFRVTASIGAVDLAESPGTPAQLLSLADTACFAAKDQGRNRVVAYHADNFEIARRHGEMAWVSRLQSAMDDSTFELFCQPICGLTKAASKGEAFEVLLRLPGEGDQQFIKPDEFLRAAENYQLAVRVDSWVCDQALKFFERQRDTLERIQLCCINLSSQSLTDDAFLDFLTRRIGIDNPLARALCFEITETGVIANLAQATTFIEQIQRLGCRFALDDFGSGVSSFAYLKELPVDIVKIDGMFVRQMAHDPIDRALVASINDIAHAMGKLTIAEYVEDEDTLFSLRDMGVDYAQGYFMGEPLPLRTFFELATA